MVANRRCPAGYLGGFVLRNTFPNTTIQLSPNHPTNPNQTPPTLVCHLALCPRVTTTLLLVPLQGYRRFLKQNKTVLRLFWHITWKILNISIFAVEMEFCVVWCWFYVNTDDSREGATWQNFSQLQYWKLNPLLVFTFPSLVNQVFNSTNPIPSKEARQLISKFAPFGIFSCYDVPTSEVTINRLCNFGLLHLWGLPACFIFTPQNHKPVQYQCNHCNETQLKQQTNKCNKVCRTFLIDFYICLQCSCSKWFSINWVELRDKVSQSCALLMWYIVEKL